MASSSVVPETVGGAHERVSSPTRVAVPIAFSAPSSPSSPNPPGMMLGFNPTTTAAAAAAAAAAFTFNNLSSSGSLNPQERAPSSPAASVTAAAAALSSSSSFAASANINTVTINHAHSPPVIQPDVPLVGISSASPERLRELRLVPILVSTWVAYALYTAQRRPFTVVRSAMIEQGHITIADAGIIDTGFLAAYALGQLFYSDIRRFIPYSSRVILVVGLVGSSAATALFGLMIIDSLFLRTLIFFIIGLFQAVGWASVLVVMTPWIGPTERGQIFGIWNTSGSLGGIFGNFLSAAIFALSNGSWSAVFIVVGLVSLIVAATLPSWMGLHPNAFNVLTADQEAIVSVRRSQMQQEFDERRVSAAAAAADPHNASSQTVSGGLSHQEFMRQTQPQVYIPEIMETDIENEWKLAPPPPEASRLTEGTGIAAAASASSSAGPPPRSSPPLVNPADQVHIARVPGVLAISAAYMGYKMVRYTLSMWLPYYLTLALGLSEARAGVLSTVFDVGAFLGAVLAGIVSDRVRSKSLLVNIMGIAQVATLTVFALNLNQDNETFTLILVFLAGVFSFGIEALISAPLLQDLASKHRVQHRIGAMGAFVNSAGTIGSILQGPFAVILTQRSWNQLFESCAAITALAVGIMMMWGREV